MPKKSAQQLPPEPDQQLSLEIYEKAYSETFHARLSQGRERGNLEAEVPKAHKAAAAAAQKACLRATHLPWNRLCNLVWERDKARCDVCGVVVAPEYYHCGHVVDRLVGGADRLDNLVCMHSVCNEAKPIHRTLEEYRSWRDGDPNIFIPHSLQTCIAAIDRSDWEEIEVLRASWVERFGSPSLPTPPRFCK